MNFRYKGGAKLYWVLGIGYWEYLSIRNEKWVRKLLLNDKTIALNLIDRIKRNNMH